MAKPFEEALKAYYRETQGIEAASIEVESDPGFRYSSYTYEDPSFKVTVRDERGKTLFYDSDADAAEFLQKLFAWEDGS